MHTPFRHPSATHAAHTVLGYRRDGRPIYPIAGGNGEGGDASGTPAGEPATQPATPAPAAAAEPPKPGPPPAAKADGDDSAATIARLEKELKDARGEAAKSRTDAKAKAADDAVKDLTQKLGKALGLLAEDTPPDPAKLAEQIGTQTTRIGELESELRQRDVELAVHSAAEKHGAKVSALLDSRAFSKTIAGLDPTSKSFPNDLDAAIKQAVDSNPSFRTAPQAGRSGADITGGPGETGKARPTSLGAAIKAALQQ